MKKIAITSNKYSFCLDGFQKQIKKYWGSPKTSFDKMIETMVLHDIRESKNEENNISL